MAIIKLRVKVRVFNEEDTDWDEDRLGTNPRSKSSTFEWKNKLIDANNIFEITEVNSKKVMIEDYFGKFMLAAISIDEAQKLWNESKDGDETNNTISFSEESNNNTGEDEE